MQILETISSYYPIFFLMLIALTGIATYKRRAGGMHWGEIAHICWFISIILLLSMMGMPVLVKEIIIFAMGINIYAAFRG